MITLTFGGNYLAIKTYKDIDSVHLSLSLSKDEYTIKCYGSKDITILIYPNHVEINAAEEFDDPDSVYGFYKKLIAMRHGNATVATGEWNLVAADSEQVYSFTRTGGDDTILVMVNLTGRTARVPAEVARLLGNGVSESQVLLSTYDAVHGVKSIARGELARWEGVVIQL